MGKKKVVIIGAGPAGLTAGYELCKKGYKPVIFEMSEYMGGISRTVEHNGNRMDIGGHRFFSKSQEVMDWWLDIFPLQSDKQQQDVMLLRHRSSFILFSRKFFDYPISFSFRTFASLGFVRLVKIMFSYLKVRVFPLKEERSLEDFFINRFGTELYETFFKTYTEKVWGIPCCELEPQWGAQRIKGISISKVLKNAIISLLPKKNDVYQKDKETSLIESFLYPKYGPGQFWETVADKIKGSGGSILTDHEVVGIKCTDAKASEVIVRTKDGQEYSELSDIVISTMPVKDLILGMQKKDVPDNIEKIAGGLMYRSFITVGVLLRDINGKEKVKGCNWIYVQEKDVKLGRIQLFNNWSPYMVKDPSRYWIGLEYFCTENDDFWNMPDEEFKRMAIGELEKIGFCAKTDVLDSVVFRLKKTYPVYAGAYNEFDKVTAFLETIPNLFLIGRNGMHRYNNMDHAILTAKRAVECIDTGKTDKKSIWSVNAEQDYLEKKNG